MSTLCTHGIPPASISYMCIQLALNFEMRRCIRIQKCVLFWTKFLTTSCHQYNMLFYWISNLHKQFFNLHLDLDHFRWYAETKKDRIENISPQNYHFRLVFSLFCTWASHSPSFDKVSGQNGPWTKTASTKTASTETAPNQNGLYQKRPLTENGLYQKRPLTEMASNWNGL